MYMIILSQREGVNKMEKFLKKYGVIIMLYFVLVCGIILLNERCRLLNLGSIFPTNFSSFLSK